MNIFEMVYMRGKIHLQLILLRNFRAQFRTQSGLIPEKHRIAFKFWCQVFCTMFNDVGVTRLQTVLMNLMKRAAGNYGS